MEYLKEPEQYWASVLLHTQLLKYVKESAG